MVLPSLPGPLGCVCSRRYPWVPEQGRFQRDRDFIGFIGLCAYSSRVSTLKWDFGRSEEPYRGIRGWDAHFHPFLGQAGAASWDQPNHESIPRLYSLCHSGLGLQTWKNCSSSLGLRAGVFPGNVQDFPASEITGRKSLESAEQRPQRMPCNGQGMSSNLLGSGICWE